MKTVAVLLFAALAFAATGCGIAVASGPEKSPIKVGVVLPLSGPHAKFGEIEKNSFLLGLEQVNANGGVRGAPLELLFEDDGSKFDRGRAAAEKLIVQQRVIALTGGYSSSVTFAVASVAQRRQIPFLVTTGSTDEITEQGWDYVFRICQPVSEYSKALIDFLQEVVKPRRVAIIYENSMFGQAAEKEFVDEVLAIGWKIVLNWSYEPETTDFKPLLHSAKAANPDVMYLVCYVNEAAQIMRQAADIDFNPKIFAAAAAGFTLPEFQKLAGEASENVISATLWTPQILYPGAKDYYEKYRQKFGSETEYHGAEAYASVHVIAEAIKKARALNPNAVRDALAKTNMMTAFGPVRFTSYGKKQQQNFLPTYVVQWQKGVAETVWPLFTASRPYVYPIPARKK